MMSGTDEEPVNDDVQKDGEDVIEWSEDLEDHTLAVLEGDLEESEDADIESFEGREGVAKINTEKYVTDFDEEFEFKGGMLELTVERSGGLNTVEYWSDDPDVMADFNDYLEERIRTVEQQPMLEPYSFEDVTSVEIADLISVYRDEFEMRGPLPRGSNGQPRMHMQRIKDLDSKNDYRKDVEEEESISAQHQIPGDAEYVIEGLDVSGNEEVEGKVKIRPQKHDLGLYTVKFMGDDAESQAYMVNTSLKAINPDKDNMYPF